MSVASPSNRLTMRWLANLRWLKGWSGLLGVALVVYLALGSVASVGTGLTFDDPMEQSTFQRIVRAAKGLLAGNTAEYNEQLQSYGDKYYGIGFDAIAYPFQVALRPYLSRISHLDPDTALLLGARPVILILFGMSIVVFYRCARFFINERPIAVAVSAFYGLNPYLFGHAMMNVRDSPFMSVYLLCTYLSLMLVKRHIEGTAEHFPSMIKLGAVTAALASIRIPGLMIVVQYAFTFFIAEELAWAGSRRIVTWKNIAGFFAALIPLVIMFFPAVWLNPVREIVTGVKFVGWYTQPGCTLTWGQCMPAYATPAYIFGWLAVKLPLFTLAGVAFVPFALKKLWPKPFQRIAYLTLLFGSVYVLIVIIPLRAHLYDETRQLLFIYPLLILSGAIAIYVTSRRVALVGVCVSLAIFAWDQVRLNPYQYVYFNEIGRFFDINRLFETDYWGLSAREHARLLNAYATESDCLYVDPTWLYRPFISPGVCVEPWSAIPQRPLSNRITVAIACSPQMTVPATCELISAVTRSLPLSNRTMKLSVAYSCRTR